MSQELEVFPSEAAILCKRVLKVCHPEFHLRRSNSVDVGSMSN